MTTTSSRNCLIGLGYLAFVVYGSLLPFEWNGLSLWEARTSFQRIAWLNLGVGSRADFVANLLLYIPLGFLMCACLAGKSRRPLVLLNAIVLSLIFCAAIALTIEYVQLLFPPRTVSLNDISAEIAGTVLGIALWPAVGTRLTQLISATFSGGATARRALLIAYAMAYAVLSLFPYDFLLSCSEWRDHLASSHTGWLFAPSCGRACAWKLAPEALAVVPLGMLGARIPRSSKYPPVLVAALAGLMLGAVIELLQLSIASGISQGASVGARAAGMMLGVALIQSIERMQWHRLRKHVRGALLVAVPPYLGALAWSNHWFSSGWLDFTAGFARLRDVHFLPFYYHYYTSEAVALVSVLFQAGLYLPVGVAAWLWHRVDSPEARGFPHVSTAAATAALAFAIEAAKLFIVGQHPDPTNILIAVISALSACLLLDMLSPAKPDHPPSRARPARGPPARASQDWPRIAGGVILLVAAVAGLSSPLGAAWVLAPLLLYAGVLWRWPSTWPVWVLALLPLLDLTPWTGRLYWTEYDTLLLATIGVGYMRLHSGSIPRAALRRPTAILLTLFAISTAISVARGLLPFAPPDQNAFVSYTSSYNALRVVKGLLFALAFIPLLTREWGVPALAARRFAIGMTLGLAAELLYVAWERVTFSGLFNFDTDYRISGSFYGMHTGGAYIECYLLAALPFVALWAWQQRQVWSTAVAAALYSLSAYSIMVTFSRGGQAAFALITLLSALGFTSFALRDRVRRPALVVAIVSISAMALGVAWPVFSGKFSQSRLAQVRQDVAIRAAHWTDAMNIVERRNGEAFGVGLGTFPSAYYWYSGESSRPSTYAFIAEDGNTFLRLGGGESLYFEQPIAASPFQSYTLSMDLRSVAKDGSALTVPICEKALLHSFTCAWTTLTVTGGADRWAHYSQEIMTRNFGPPGSYFQRPIKLSLYNGKGNTLIDVDNVSLLDANGNDLVRNGTFSDGMHHWFFSTDSHLPWHVKNIYLHVLFEQGWFGLSIFLALIVCALTYSLGRAREDGPLGLTLISSLTAFLAIGTVDSLVDETRLAFLFYLLLIVPAMIGQSLDPRPVAGMKSCRPAA